MSEFRLNVRNTIIVVFVLIGIFSLFVFGMMGFRTIIGILLLFLISFYFILKKTALTEDEKVMFSFFLSIGFFPAIVYYLGLFVGVRKAIIVTFVILLAAGIIINKVKK